MMDTMYAGALDLDAPLAWTVPDVLSEAECAAQIARMEQQGLQSAPITMGPNRFEHRPERRNNGRVILEDAPLAAELFRRLQAHCPSPLMGMVAVGANERLRCYRYQPGQYFRLHHDGAFTRSPVERSLLTLMVYLNEGFEGGETNFPELKLRFTPRRGMALLFQHMLLHEGCEVLSGTKYALRSDVMYASSPPVRAVTGPSRE